MMANADAAARVAITYSGPSAGTAGAARPIKSSVLPSVPVAQRPVGEWVEVRSKAEILATLDARGRLDDMPFMPEMFQYCGRRFRIYKRAHKTCDTATGAKFGYRGRSLPGTVHLDLRCDGSGHNGCQAGCLLFWKEAWLKPVGEAAQPVERRDVSQAASGGCTEDDVQRATRCKAPVKDAGKEDLYVCQATALPDYTRPLQWWNPQQYIDDYRSGNVSLGRMITTLFYAFYVNASGANSRRWGRPGRWIYDRVQLLIGGEKFPRYTGTIPINEPTPRDDLNLQPGDWVRVKSYDAILATLNTAGANRNMNFDAELVPYCGKIFQVKTRVERFVDEADGKFKRVKTPAVILDGVFCQARYSDYRYLCPRSIYSWWRENWLERIDAPAGLGDRTASTEAVNAVGCAATAGAATADTALPSALPGSRSAAVSSIPST